MSPTIENGFEGETSENPVGAVTYYFLTLQSTLQVIDKLLSLQTLKSFGENTGDLLLTILSHVMKIEAVIKEKTPEVTPAAPSTETATTSGAVVARPVEAAIPPALQSLMDMGFSREAAAEALTYNGNNVEQAADYLLAVQPDRVLRTTGKCTCPFNSVLIWTWSNCGLRYLYGRDCRLSDFMSRICVLEVRGNFGEGVKRSG